MAQKRFFNFVAYIAVLCTAVAVVLEYIFGRNTSAGQVCDWIAFICMLIVVVVSGFLFAKSKRRLLWILLYLVAVVVIIIFKILPLF